MSFKGDTLNTADSATDRGRSALIVGYYGAGNLGDELMLFCLKKWLEDQGIQVTVAAQFPEVVESLQRLPAVPNLPLLGQWSWVESYLKGQIAPLWKALYRSDLVIVGGGDIIRDDIGGKTFLYSVEKLLVAILAWKSASLINVGIGEPRTKPRRRLLQFLLRRCKSIIVRDESSLQLCRRFGAVHAILAPDIVFELPRIANMKPVPEGKRVLVCLREDANVYGRFVLNETRIANFAAALDHLIDARGLEVAFVPFQSSESGDDNRLHELVRSQMKFRDRAEILPWEFDMDRLLRLFGEAACVIAMRLHAGVLGAACGRRVLVLPYDRKVTEFAKQFHCLAVEANQLDELATAIFGIESVLAVLPTSCPESVWGRLRLT